MHKLESMIHTPEDERAEDGKKKEVTKATSFLKRIGNYFSVDSLKDNDTAFQERAVRHMLKKGHLKDRRGVDAVAELKELDKVGIKEYLRRRGGAEKYFEWTDASTPEEQERNTVYFSIPGQNQAPEVGKNTKHPDYTVEDARKLSEARSSLGIKERGTEDEKNL